MTRPVVTFALLLALALAGRPPVAAQDATPEASPAAASPLAAMGYPELRITLSATGLEATHEVPAGLTLITVENTGAEDVNGAILVKLADGVTLEDLQPPTGTPPREDVNPDWFYRATIVGDGGSFADPRSAANLTPGDWAVLPYPDVTARVPAPFTVTGNAASPVAGDLPPVGMTATEYDFGFTLSTPSLPTGPVVWEVVNVGAQPHEMAVFRFPTPVTPEQFVEQYKAGANVPEDSATPPPQPYFGWETIEFVGGVSALSFQQRAWAAYDLAPGHYLAICFLGDPHTGMSHVELGMVQAFTVG